MIYHNTRYTTSAIPGHHLLQKNILSENIVRGASEFMLYASQRKNGLWCVSWKSHEDHRPMLWKQTEQQMARTLIKAESWYLEKYSPGLNIDVFMPDYSNVPDERDMRIMKNFLEDWKLEDTNIIFHAYNLACHKRQFQSVCEKMVTPIEVSNQKVCGMPLNPQ